MIDYPKENYFKKKQTPSVPHFHQKHTPRIQTQAHFVSSNKGKIRVEQYEYDEENMLGQGYTSKVYLGRLVENSRKQFAIKVVDKKKISRVKENL